MRAPPPPPSAPFPTRRSSDLDPRRRLTLLEAVKRGFDYVDVELRSGFMDVMVEKVGEGLIVSHHDIRGMPEDLDVRSEEHTSELQSLRHLVCRLLLEQKK